MIQFFKVASWTVLSYCILIYREINDKFDEMLKKRDEVPAMMYHKTRMQGEFFCSCYPIKLHGEP